MRGGGVFKAAVAFAVGIVVGCLGLAPSLAGSADSRVAGLSTAVAQVRGELEVARAQLRSADSVVLDVGRETLAGTLAERSVMVVYAGGVRDADVTKVRGLLADAGARDAGSMRLREAFFTPAMKNIASNVLPAGATLSEDKLDVGTRWCFTHRPPMRSAPRGWGHCGMLGFSPMVMGVSSLRMRWFS